MVMDWDMLVNENILEVLLDLDAEVLATKFMWSFHHYSNFDFFLKCLADEKSEFLKYLPPFDMV